MARLVHPSGDLNIDITAMASQGDTLVVKGRLGVWDADIYLAPREVARIIRLALNWRTLAYLLRLPLLLFRGGSRA